MVQRADFVQAGLAASDEWAAVVAIADDLTAHLGQPSTAELLLAANQPGMSSALVQATFREQALALGFVDESKGLFAAYESALRPDYFRRVGASGIILEVE